MTREEKRPKAEGWGDPVCGSLAREREENAEWAVARSLEKKLSWRREWSAMVNAADSFFKIRTGSWHWLG